MDGVRVRAMAIAVAVGLFALLVSACGESTSGPDPNNHEVVAAARQYRSALKKDAATLVSWLTRLTAAVETGRLTQAQSRYASARVPYGQLEPVVADVPQGHFGGFHRIEETLWVDHTVDRLGPPAKHLLSNAKSLQAKVGTVDLEPRRIARNINRTLDDVLASEIAGREEPHSHLDLVDIAANIEGVEAGFKALRPFLTGEAGGLVREAEASFGKVYLALSDFGFAAREPDQPRPSSPGTSFVLYVERSAAEFRRLGQRIAALAGVLERIPAQIAEA